MSKENVDDYLQEGIYGSRQTKPGERKMYLGTLRERIILLLSKSEVMQQDGLDELEKQMKVHKDASLLLNGEVTYDFRRPYRQLANKNNIHTTTVSNQETETDVGAILTVDYAIEKEDIHIETKAPPKEESEPEGGFKAFLKSLFKPSN
ncbi:YueI family protein [Halobacillus sp. A1]|uniref:YueI family protein n=1 Tax=Halobacillus sp. A1 TaxID=2880262 RepID=UPI0020A6BFA0|nr:YueI family protein [Halobacillus sp. A1]MCP3029858.1 YueI family protein [Halobacillus sp. A1]